MPKHIYIIVAVDQKNGIGKDGGLPWKFTKEIQHFKEITTKTADETKINAVIMGRKTWESLPLKFRPLTARKNIIITSRKNFESPGAEIAFSLEEACDLAFTDENVEKIFIIGGAMVFEASLHHPYLIGIYKTDILATYDCDTFFPEIPMTFKQKIKLGQDAEDNTKFEYWLLQKEISE